MSWSAEELESWRESLSEIASEAEALSGDPMLAEYIAEQESAKSALSESWSESSDPDFSAAMDAYADRPVGPWDMDPGWSPWASEEAEAEALSVLDDWAEAMSEEAPRGRSGGHIGAGGAFGDMDSGAEFVEDSGAEVGPGEVVVVSSEVMSESARERAAAFRRWEEDGPRLSVGSSSAVYDDFGDRVDDDGREARGLVRVPGSKGDGRAYWWAFSCWVSAMSVESWSEAMSSAEVEGLAILHDRDAVAPHVHGVVRRAGGRLKGSERQIRRAVASWLGCRAEVLSVAPVDDTRAAVAYLTHESVPGGAGKHRYDRAEVVESGGVHLSDWSAERGSDWVAVVSDMQTCIDAMLARGRRVSLQGFISWCHIEAPDWWRLLVVKRAARLYLKDYLKA